MNNIYSPFKSEIMEVLDIGRDVKLFKVLPERKADYSPGQFFMVSKWGSGEVPISVASTRGNQRHLEFGIKKAGSVTAALHRLKAGDKLWLRGPYGNGFSTAAAKKKDVIFIAGGIGLLPLRSLINSVLMKKSQFETLSLLYGSKTPSEILFASEMNIWNKKGLEIILTVDIKNEGWKGNTGLVTQHVAKIRTDFANAFAYICGPEVMIRNTIRELSLRGMSDKRIVTTLEARMKCGMGKCGQCYHGTEYICTNGPVYTYEEMKKRLKSNSA